jgi:ubiquinone biosynthesis protein
MPSLSLSSIPQLARNINRVREIVTILGKYGLADWISRLDLHFARGLVKSSDGQGLSALTRETRIRLALVELGTTFIKFGQMLSTRPDLVGSKLALELTSLQASVPADAAAVVHATIRGELGHPINELFAEFDDRAIASASIGQVHRARLPTGQAVAVKVQHPGIEARIRVDLSILAVLADLASQYLPETRQYQPKATVAEFQRMLLRELDFGREERNLQTFASNFTADATVCFPTVYSEYSTGRVLTMEFLDGIPLNDASRLRAAGHPQEDLARRGAAIFMEMIFRDGFYHADPHPGNFLIMPDGAIGILDCGMIGRLDEKLRETMEEILVSLVHGDAVALCEVIIRLGAVPTDLDHAGLGADVTDFVSYYGRKPIDQIDLANALNEVTDLVRRYRIVLPTPAALLIKVLIMLEGTSRLLNPRFSLVEVMKPFQKRLIWRRLSPERHLQRARRVVQNWQHLGEVLPRNLIGILEQVNKGSIEVHLEHQRLEPSVNRLVLGMLTSALFVGSTLLWSYQAPPLIAGIPILGVVGSLASLGLGLRLLWAIRKSGHLEKH